MGATINGMPQRLPATVPAGPSASDAATVSRTVARLRHTEHGREVADYLVANDVKIRVVPDALFRSTHAGLGGVYDPRDRVISVPHAALGRTDLITTIAHEGTHAKDFSTRPNWLLQSVSTIAGSVGDAAKGLVTLRNPLTTWLNSVTARQHDDEVHAYGVQAQVAHELGMNESAWSHGQAKDGTPLPLEEVRSSIASDPLYRMGSTQRLVVGGGLGVGITMGAAFGAQAIASRLRPGSFLASHMWPTIALGGAMAGAWVIADQIRARSLEAEG